MHEAWRGQSSLLLHPNERGGGVGRKGGNGLGENGLSRSVEGYSAIGRWVVEVSETGLRYGSSEIGVFSVMGGI